MVLTTLVISLRLFILCCGHVGANNLIPMEIALKIADKIRAKERFAAYIVIPMWPEGAPTSNPIQRILYWQVNNLSIFC